MLLLHVSSGSLTPWQAALWQHLSALTPSTCIWSCLATPVVAAPTCHLPASAMSLVSSHFSFYFIFVFTFPICPHLCPCVHTHIHIPVPMPSALMPPTCTQSCLAVPVVATPACLPLQKVWWVVISLFTLFLCSHFQSAHVCVPVPYAHAFCAHTSDSHLITPGCICCGHPHLPASVMNLVSSLYYFYFILVFMNLPASMSLCSCLCPFAHACLHSCLLTHTWPWLLAFSYK